MTVKQLVLCALLSLCQNVIAQSDSEVQDKTDMVDESWSMVSDLPTIDISDEPLANTDNPLDVVDIDIAPTELSSDLDQLVQEVLGEEAEAFVVSTNDTENIVIFVPQEADYTTCVDAFAVNNGWRNFCPCGFHPIRSARKIPCGRDRAVDCLPEECCVSTATRTCQAWFDNLGSCGDGEPKKNLPELTVDTVCFIDHISCCVARDELEMMTDTDKQTPAVDAPIVETFVFVTSTAIATATETVATATETQTETETSKIIKSVITATETKIKSVVTETTSVVETETTSVVETKTKFTETATETVTAGISDEADESMVDESMVDESMVQESS